MPARLLAVLLCLTCLSGGRAQVALRDSLPPLRDGDLLFVLPATPNAITAVREDESRVRIDHVAVYHRHRIYEAVPEGVQAVSLDAFLSRYEGTEPRARIQVGRIDTRYARRRSMRRVRRLLGRPYDDLYLHGDSAVYCSELVQLCYMRRDGQPLFEPIPLSFHDGSGRILPQWEAYYRQRGRSVPEGLPGSHPARLYTHPAVRIVH